MFFSSSAHPPRHLHCCLLLYLLCANACSLVANAPDNGFRLDQSELDTVSERFGQPGVTRVIAWQEFIRHADPENELELVRQVNAFFNALPFVADSEHWQRLDYWATPIEFLASNGGDCEDFSVAKYVTLRTMGIPEDNVRLTYVNARTLDQPHMVVTYHRSPETEPIVLDNLIPELKPVSERADLSPIYSFNESGLWLNNDRWHGRMIGGSTHLQRWQEVIRRLQNELGTPHFF